MTLQRTRRAVRLAAAAIMALLLAAPPAAAEDGATMNLDLPADFSIAHGVMLSGHLDLPGAAVQNASFAAAREVRFEPGTLTVCPAVAARQALPATLAVVLGSLNTTCAEGETFIDPQVTFSPGTGIATAGLAGVQDEPAAGLASFSKTGGAIVLSSDGINLQRPADLFRMIPVSRADQVFITTERGTRTYNGTEHAFLHDGRAARFLADGIAGQWGEPHIVISPAGVGALTEAFQPFVLLDLQAQLRGPDAREPRGNVSGMLYEYGRVPAFVNGAIVGRLAGTAGGADLDGSVALLRGDGFDLQVSGRQLTGTYSERLAISADGVSVSGGPSLGPPWWLAIPFWAGAAVILAIRRAAPVRGKAARAAWWIGVPVAFLVVDLFVMAGLLGTSALAAAGDGSGAGAVFALATFEAAAVALSWLLLALPLRLAVGRTSPARLLPALEGAAAVVWLAILFLLPGSVVALALKVARL